jgi:DNA adenine methylase
MNNVRPALFIEPFAGGASVALQLLNDGLVQRVALADKDPLVASFWRTAFFDADWLIKRIESIDVTLDQWQRYKRKMPRDCRGQALACLFLNRTSFSGIMAPTAGPIGGINQSSDYDIACRFPRETLIRRIRQVQQLADRVEFVWNLSWAKTLSLVGAMQLAGSLTTDVAWYFDPPFFERANRLYRHYFDAAEHVRFRDKVLELQEAWVLSYDSVAKVDELYGEARKPAHVEALYSTGSNGGHIPIKEALVTNLPYVPEQTRLWRRSHEWKRNGTTNGHNNDLQLLRVTEEGA